MGARAFPPLVLDAAHSVRAGESLDRAVGWYWCLGGGERRAAVDEWILATGHPLAQEPGTAEQRFRALVREAIAGD